MGDRPTRKSVPSYKITSTDNIGEILPSHLQNRDRAAAIRNEQQNAHRKHANAETIVSVTKTLTPNNTLTQTATAKAITPEQDERAVIEVSDAEVDVDVQSKNKRQRTQAPAPKPVAEDESDQAGSDAEADVQPKNKRQRTQAPAPKPVVEDESDQAGSGHEEKKSVKDRRQDVDAFFGPPRSVDKKMKRKCPRCSRNGVDKVIVNEVTTLRRHLESKHEPAYRQWCEKNNFQSMLPKVIAARKTDAKNAVENLRQSTMDPHVQTAEVKRTLPYTDATFREAAIEWLSTDQPIQALEHPAFHKMIDIASRSTNGVNIPDRKATRAFIIARFKKNLSTLCKRLNGPAVSGLISSTCDAWSASNGDAYFAVTIHWIEETSPGVWIQQSALAGFTQMNTAHDGVRLGYALFKVFHRLGIIHKVGWVTCDNATNNDTMGTEFAKILDAHDSRKALVRWNPEERRVRCLAHVINLATQAVIKTYSNTKYFNPAQPEEHEPDTRATDDDGITVTRDEVGLICAIAVKAHSSAKRKQLLKDIQLRAKASPLQLLIDMPVRWSSTYVMLHRADVLKTYMDTFVYEMGMAEPNLIKRRKLDSLQLTTEEWGHLSRFMSLLTHSDNAQQAEKEPSLHIGIPALESLHRAWSSRCTRLKYGPFHNALAAGIAKIEEYYDKITDNPAYIISMLLNPEEKMTHFKKHWDKRLQKDVRDLAKSTFKERWEKMYGSGVTQPQLQHSVKRKQDILLRQLSESEDEDDDESNNNIQSQVDNPAEPWLKEFDRYLSEVEKLPENMKLVAWWGINAGRYPVWSSLARDYLPIMASSVSSERAFSSGGMTITKRRNRLKGDIVEALQFLKCWYRQDLLFRDPAPTSSMELSLMELEVEDMVESLEDSGNSEVIGCWDELIIDGGDEEDPEIFEL